ncbi:NACHT domain- and WD repeat-containing protein 1 [Acanthopagrus latus]|uniref:NACHT domain- and WD repeat-containing protein 1 n=1 Tax=Acanthopagrus latus TaxID=8177 RepID=UPI00187C3E3E|nr:NACHT domain- and WD repeat-containing protein 1 [Acanthopagrus latus]XP_036971747.1 NACHT domain- and WD repeat-containing protein 1 [Acanthopagrus latus]XP_036971748.1 NACHT domain- and WD repeat-containing protein 1 [Acanthopagrus latus]XP_036971749.1 NACHT domain- and WD repeat-containing protein 1 [Acanthopagrus latus]XP_036971750.1 NACHT domain- and WD repeat-containing protein 1 [Acanthopagrus latus]XP_036971751.1 NACHT domain- and WD repeat-containing protein 1 [Acanthopagrus latus]
MAEHRAGGAAGAAGAAGAGEVSLQDVLRGRTGGAQRMKTSSNMIRVFVSSTFTDMSSERKALLERSYPEVLAFCRSLGLVFEVVDLRWGIRGDVSGDHEASEIFLQEIRSCKKISAGPTFIALLGNRYGHRGLPRLILEKQFEVLLSKLARNPEGIEQLNHWFLKDNNAVPPTYVLQPVTAHFPHYSDLRPECGPQRDKNVLSWHLTETQLLQLLRSAATDAEAAGDITAEQKHDFFTSVTEQEFKEGLWKDAPEASALLFVREIPRQKARDGPKRFAKFMDLTADGLLDAEAQGLLTGLKSRLYAKSQKILNLHCVELSKGSIDPKRKEHAQYLDGVCELFVSQMKARIEAAVDPSVDGRHRRIWGNTEEEKGEISDWLVEEVAWHTTVSAELCRDLYGREGLLGKLCLAMWESTNVRHGPLVVHGAAGMGKTALLSKLAQEMRSVLDAGAVVVIRLLSARHPQRLDIDQVLRSICFQICLACGLTPPSPLTANTYLELLRFFRNVLSEVSQQGNTLLILLDALDQLSDQHHAHKLHWLPASIPPNVHLVVSTGTNSEVFANMRLKFGTSGSFFEVERLSRDDGRQIVESYLRACQRTLTPEQSVAVLNSFEPTGCPLHLKLILSVARRWTSFTPLTGLRLGANLHEMMSQLLLMLEDKHGKELVGGALTYIALAREGLLEAELRDVMSLDDDVISAVYRYSLPPTPSLIRLPPFLWARLRRDLEDQLEERWTGGVATIGFNSRRLCEAVSARYLTSEQRGRSLRILAEYFLGRWSGKLKPAALPGLSLLLSDRKVPPQPLWFAPGLANVRKLQELPHHLLHAGLWDELRQEVIGSAEWLYCKSRVCGVSTVIQDLDQCSQYMDCTETRLVRDALVLMKPSLDFLDGHMDMSLFYTELLARLCSLATPFPSMIGQLCSQCEEWLLTCPEPILLPKCSFLQQPGGALQRTLTGLTGGVLCMDVSVEAELLLAGSDDGVVAVWSLADQQLIHCLLGHTGAVLSVKVIDSSSHCLSLAADGSLRRWSLMDGQQLLCIQEAVPIDSAPSSVHLHLCEQNQVLFVHSCTQVKVLKLDGSELLSSSSSSDDGGSVVLGVLGDSVFSLCGSGRVRICHPVSGTQTVETQLENCQGGLTVVKSATLPKHGKVFIVSADGVLHQVSRSGRQTAAEFPLVPSLLSVTEDEKILIAGSDRTLSLFNVDQDSVDRFLDLQHEDSVLSACVSSDCRLLVSGAADQLIRIWSVTTGALLDSLCGSDSPVTSLALYNNLVISASAAAAGVHLWSLKYDTRHKPVAHIPAGCAHVAITKDTDRVFYVRQQSQTEVISWNNLTGSLSERLAVSAQVCCLELAQNKRLLLCGLTTGTVLIYPLALPQETLCIPPPESLSRVLCLAVSPQEKHVAVAYEDSVRLFEITTRDSFPTVEGPLKGFPLSLLHGPPSSMALLSNRWLLYGTSCGEVKLHDFSSGSSSDLEPHRSRVTCVTGSTWGTHALVGSEDAVQRLWALNPLVLDHTMEYKGFFFEGVLSAAFSDSDQFVFTGSQDRTVKVWDVSSGKLLYVQYVYAPVVRMVTFRNGFVALSQQGAVIKEVFRCPDHVSPDYNPLRNVKAQYRVTSREKTRDDQQSTASDLKDFNPAQFNLNLMGMLRSKPSSSSTCLIL